VLITLVAIVLIGWFVALARNHAIGSGASDRIVADPAMSAADWRHAMHDFERAHLLDPSTDWSLIQAQYELLRDKGAALKRAENALREEPDNLSAWWVVLRAARDSDPARYREAVAAIHRLNPTPAGR
jgi:tetratricopeptide (TPR) repeat protein